MSRIKRRTFMSRAAAAAGATVAASSLGLPAFAQSRNIRHFWWGNPERDKRTFAVIDIFNGKNGMGIHVDGETLGFGDYFAKLTTQIAGGNMPDCIQQGYGVMLEYVDKGTLKPLDEFVGGALDLSKFDKSAVDAGTFRGKFYGLSIGANSMASIYNTRIFSEAGIDIDPITWTYDDLKAASLTIKEKTGVAGTDDLTADYGGFGVYAGQRGFANMFNDDGQFAFDVQLVVDFFKLWEDMRDAGATPSGEDSAALAGISDLDKQNVVTGKSAVSYAWSNQIVGTQALMTDKVGAGMRPHLAGGSPGQSIQPSQFICLSRDTVDAEAGVAYMNAFVNDPDMTAVLGLERGIPSQSDVRAALQPNLSEAEAVSVAYFDAIQPYVGPLAPPPPAGNRECEDAFEQRAGAAVLLGQMSIEDAAAQFMQEASDILARA
ncbi:MAG: carbohydrate ABC transporter substrate-binding protein [Hyphomicrobiaceae bacterium]|nr:carbohydrate ABC transporter substrate-binding protein [Hyphomicrobiaceae bacterium]